MNELPRTFRTAHALASAGLVDTGAQDALARVAERYAVAITPAMAALIVPSDVDDPIARQFVPDARELVTLPHERADPISDLTKSPTKGLVHRYSDRVLLKIASVCPVYCRFCFRREMVGPQLGQAMTHEDLKAAITYIRTNQHIREVIMTGGDPFVLSPKKISEVTRSLGEIEHLEVIRWHTRVPVVDPSRVTDALTRALNASDKNAVVAIHANHPRELTSTAREAVARLIAAGIPLLSQTVLLKGVNDNVATLEALLRALCDCGVKPYYLHHGDLAPGTSHFRTSIEAGLALMQELRKQLPAKGMPRYVLDTPGGHGKVDIETNVEVLGGGSYMVRDARDNAHLYRDPVTA